MKLGKHSIIGYVVGIGIFVIMMLLQLGLLSEITLERNLKESALEGLLSGTMILAVAASNVFNIKIYGNDAFAASCIQTSAVVLLLLFGALIADGEYQNVGMRLGSVAVGFLISYLICRRNVRKTKRSKRHYR